METAPPLPGLATLALAFLKKTWNTSLIASIALTRRAPAPWAGQVSVCRLQVGSRKPIMVESGLKVKSVQARSLLCNCRAWIVQRCQKPCARLVLAFRSQVFVAALDLHRAQRSVQLSSPRVKMRQSAEMQPST